MFDKDAITKLQEADAISAAHASLSAHDHTGDLVTLPSDYKLHDLEQYLPRRRRARGAMTTNGVSDFASYAAMHAEAGACVFVQQDEMTAVAVLNLGTPIQPGHADNLVKLAPKKTAAYTALTNIANGAGNTQKTVAEFLEDWPGYIKCFNDAGAIEPPKAIAAIRKISIEALRKQENTEQQLGTTKSAFESVQATSTGPLPTTIYFVTEPYHGLSKRSFVLRLGILTGGDKPTISLRIVNKEQHAEDMAAELAQLVFSAISSCAVDMPVLVGSYSVRG